MIEINSVVKSYSSPLDGVITTILDIENLIFEKGNSYAIHGASGIGKTTLLHLISGLVRPDSGSIKVNGKELTSMSESQKDRFRAKNIGYVFQTFNLLDGFTALENVLLGMTFTGVRSDRTRAVEMLDNVGLSHRLNYYPSQLSVGQQQRVSIARALVNNPDIILADEPTGNLDPIVSKDILDLLLRYSDSKILITVTHDESIVERFTKTIDLNLQSRSLEVIQ